MQVLHSIMIAFLSLWRKALPVLRLLLRRFFLGFLSIHKELQEIGTHVMRTERQMTRRFDRIEERLNHLELGLDITSTSSEASLSSSQEKEPC